MNLLTNLAWAFNGISYDSPDEFNKALIRYQADAGRSPLLWDPDEVVLETPSVQIAYQFYPGHTDVRFPDEVLVEDDSVPTPEDDGAEENEQREIRVTFTADNGFYFTALELMYKIHQRLWHRQLGEHIYFEGLLVCNVPERINLPLFYLHCGQ